MKKRIIWMTFIAIGISAFFSQRSIAIQSNNFNEELIKLISEMTTRFNEYRSKTSEIYKRYGFESKQMIENEHLIAHADAQNLEQARKVLDRYGFPTFSMVGSEKAHEFWVIVQSCNLDAEFQMQALKKMDKLLEEEEVDHRDYAYLTDRVRLNVGLKQSYGTQLRFNEKTKTYEPYELDKPETLEERRKEMNLEPMQNYIKAMNKKYEGSLKRNKDSRRLKKKL